MVIKIVHSNKQEQLRVTKIHILSSLKTEIPHKREKKW